MSAYQNIVIVTYENFGEPATERIRARPVSGQGLDTSMKVECSSKMREKHPIGIKLLIRAKVTNRKGGIPFLYCHYSWTYKVLTDEEADAFIKRHNPNSR